MKPDFRIFFAVAGITLMTGCATPPTTMAYWQRVEDDTSLWMHGPKAQQELEQNIAACVREVDELVELNALRHTTPPNTHSDYRRALDASGDLAFYDSPTRYGTHHVSHTDFHDFESCMRFKGWERVNYVRYQTAAQSHKVYKNTQAIRKWGVSDEAATRMQEQKAEEVQANYANLNQ